MPSVILIIYCIAIAQGLMVKLRDSPEISLVYESEYHKADIAISNYGAKSVLIEATEAGIYDIDYCLKLCKSLRIQTPECKLLLMCPEQNEKSVKQVVFAKAENEIDDFVFYDVTIDYLASKLISI